MQIFGINMAMGSFNRFVRDVEYAKIDRETIWHNLSSEWVWDDNNFEVNQIGHPVQGSLYYSAARANGHGYFMGLAYTTLGSIHWEYFMETEPPALNDLITTRMGGAMIGETTWRLAELLSGESTGERVGWLRKSGAFLVNPMFGMDRLINGTRHRPPTVAKGKLIGLRISSGRVIGKGITRTNGTTGEPSSQVPIASTNIRLAHGDPFQAKRPFDHFTLMGGVSVLTDPAFNVSLRAQIWQLPVRDWGASRHVFQVTQNYDYLDSPIYRLSANSLGIEWLERIDFGGNTSLWTRVQPVFIALGAASTEYYLNVQRDYNLGTGAGWKIGLVLRKPGLGMINAFSDRYWIRTQSGAAGDEIIDIHSIEIQKDVWKAFGIGGSYNVYDRLGSYRDHPDVSIFKHEFRILGTLTF